MQASPRRVASALTATLPLWDTSATRPGSSGTQRVAPQRRALVQRHDAVAVGAAHRQPVAARAAVGSRLAARAPPRDLAEARPVDDRPAAAGRAGRLDGGRRPRRPGSRPRPRRRGSGRSASDGKQGTPCACVAAAG